MYCYVIIRHNYIFFPVRHRVKMATMRYVLKFVTCFSNNNIRSIWLIWTGELCVFLCFILRRYNATGTQDMSTLSVALVCPLVKRSHGLDGMADTASDHIELSLGSVRSHRTVVQTDRSTIESDVVTNRCKLRT